MAVTAIQLFIENRNVSRNMNRPKQTAYTSQIRSPALNAPRIYHFLSSSVRPSSVLFFDGVTKSSENLSAALFGIRILRLCTPCMSATTRPSSFSSMFGSTVILRDTDGIPQSGQVRLPPWQAGLFCSRPCIRNTLYGICIRTADLPVKGWSLPVRYGSSWNPDPVQVLRKAGPLCTDGGDCRSSFP